MLKATGGSLAAAGLFATSGVSTSGGQPISPEETTPPHPDVEYRKVDKSVRMLSPHYPLLTLPEDTVMEYINGSDKTAAERREAREKLVELRRDYPIVKRKDGNVTWLTLAEGAKADVSKKTARKFQEVNRVFADGATGKGKPVDAFYEKNLHEKMTNDACNEMGLSDSTRTDIKEHADEPDEPVVPFGVPDWVPHAGDIRDGLKTATNLIMHNYAQYYDEDAFYSYTCYHDDHADDFGAVGGAPEGAQWHMDMARDSTGSTRNTYLGRLTHFPQDMGVPLHTGMGWEQANLYLYYDTSCYCVKWGIDPMYWLHYEYENYVTDNWTGGHYLKWEFGDDNCDADYCYYPINDTKQAIMDMAAYSGQYSYDCYHHILDEGNVPWTDWDSDTKDWMQKITENCIQRVGLYTIGFIEEFY